MEKSRFFGMWAEHCAGDFPSILDEPQHVLSTKEAEELAAYLENCPIWIASPGLERSIFHPLEFAGTLSIRTDGEWAWQDTMAHYVRKIGISPPTGFIKTFHERKGKWPSGGDVNVSQMDFPDF